MRSNLTPIVAVSWYVLLLANPPARADLVPSDLLVELRAAQAYERACTASNDEEAIRLLTAALGCPQKRCSAYVNRATIQMCNDQLDEAAADIAAALAIANDELETLGPSAWGYEQRARVYEVADQLEMWRTNSFTGYARTASDLERALELEPRRRSALERQCDILFARRDWGGLILTCNKLLALDPTDYRSYWARCDACHESGRFTQAIEDCDTLLKVFPEATRLEEIRADCYAKAGCSHASSWKEGLERCNAAIEQDPTQSAPYGARARIYFQMGQARKALLDIERSLQRDPQHHAGDLPLTNYLCDASLTYMRSLDDVRRRELEGDCLCIVEEGVMPILDRICQIAPEKAECLLMRAWVHAVLGCPEAGLPDFQRVRQMDVGWDCCPAVLFVRETYFNLIAKKERNVHVIYITSEYPSTADSKAPASDAVDSSNHVTPETLPLYPATKP